MKKISGITLIALVITIILLLILAGITILTLTGENGLLEKAKSATEKTTITSAEEIIKLEILENKIAGDEQLENNQLIEKIVRKLKSEGYNIEQDNDTVTEGKEQIRISDYLEKIKPYTVVVNAPKNSIITLKYNGKKVATGEVHEEDGNKSNINVYRELGDKIVAECKINDEVIYEKTFILAENNTINMYPCEENGDGKALYWYGMEFSDFESGAVQYGGSTTNIGTCTKQDNGINLYFNDTFYSAAAGIGINCKEDLTNYSSIEINVKNLTFTEYGVASYFVGDVANNYYYTEVGVSEDSIAECGVMLSSGIKNINISAINGSKYISLINYNWAGTDPYRYGSVSSDIVSILLK